MELSRWRITYWYQEGTCEPEIREYTTSADSESMARVLFSLSFDDCVTTEIIKIEHLL